MTNVPLKTYRVVGMDCAHCAEELQTGIAHLDGVAFAEVDFASATLRVNDGVAFDALQGRAAAFGKQLIAQAEAAPAEHAPTRGGLLGFWDYLLARRETQLALIGGAIVLLTLAAQLLGLPARGSAVLYTLGMAITLIPIVRSGFSALWINRTFSINLLMTVAAVGAVILGEYLEAATVIFLFAVGEALEGYTVARARDSLKGLMTLRPATARQLHDDQEHVIPVEQLAVGDVILVKPGEQVPTDGVITRGGSSVNQAAITGESIPVTKAAGDAVYAATLNGEGTLIIEVTRLAADNTLNRLIRLVEDAQSVRAPSQRLIDRFAHYYTPAIVLIALGVALIPPLAFGASFWDVNGTHGWLYRALALLVIACPCALVISTPVTVISAITAAARRGVLIKGGAALEALGQIKAVAFDKTGTLTQGKPQVTAYRAATCETGVPCAACDDVLALASAVERRTTHPLADAVVHHAEAHHLADVYAPAESVELLAGQGVRGVVNGQSVTVGSHRLFDEQFPHSDALCASVNDTESRGQTTMLVAVGKDVRGMIALADAPRPTSRAVVGQLEALGMHTVMLTGDNAAVAHAVGAIVGVSDIRAGLLPQDKLAAVRALGEQYGAVAMVGDGINDTPALAAATVGIAMGAAGSPQALETASIALMADDLTQLPFAVRLARFARRLILQNVALSFALKLVFVGLAIFGGASLWAAIFADVGMSLLVTLNGMRPLRYT